jgi:hypothetical protein
MRPSIFRQIALQGLVAASVGVPALADTYDIRRSGYWTAFGGTDKGGNPVCGVIASGQEGRTFTIKQWLGDDYFVVQIFKRAWRIPKNEEIAVLLRFDNFDAWTAKASALPPEGIQFKITRGRSEEFFREFALANKFILSFPEGTETDWSGNLTGSAAITMTFIECVTKMYGGGTQPYGGGSNLPSSPNSSQPYRR